MKRIYATFFFIFFLCMVFTSCASVGNETVIKDSDFEISGTNMQEWMHTECSKDYVTEFMSIL